MVVVLKAILMMVVMVMTVNSLKEVALRLMSEKMLMNTKSDGND